MKNYLVLSMVLAIASIASARPLIDVDSLAHSQPQRVVIDISHYQGEDINFEKVKQSVNMIYIKATEGMNIDPLFISSIKKAKEAKMLVSGYLFFSERSGARDQAYKFISTVKSAGVDLDLIPMVDVERISIYSPTRLLDSVKVALQCLSEEFKCKPLIYSGERFFLDYLQDLGKDYPLWIAKYGPKPPNLAGFDYVLWQKSEEGIVNGINSRVDVSTFNDGHHPKEIKLPSSSKNDDRTDSKSSKKDKKRGKGNRRQKE